MLRVTAPALLIVLLLAAGCAAVDDDAPLFSDDAGSPDSVGPFTDSGDRCKDPAGDYDGDGIPNGTEGCRSARDSDGDKVPDWQDFDSDDDKIPDSIEKGAGEHPVDTEGDKVPDYLDQDSDGDGLLDGEEDYNGDGLVGCCLSKCNAPDPRWQRQHCKLTQQGCGAGQACMAGLCKPRASFHCTQGELDPRRKDTLGDGYLDSSRSFNVCRDATKDRPHGRKPVMVRKSSQGSWQVALDTRARYTPLAIQALLKGEAAAAVDFDQASQEVAGFVVSRESTQGVNDEVADLLDAVQSVAKLGGATASVPSSGSTGKSHDMYDRVEGTLVDVDLPLGMDVSTARSLLVAALLARPLSAVTNLPSSFGAKHTALSIRFTTVRRFNFKKDNKGQVLKDNRGYPLDDGDKTGWSLVVVGAVAAKKNIQDPNRHTGILFHDLSNGSALAALSYTLEDRCDSTLVTRIPKADIIWVIDESGSMTNNRQDIVANANDFFSRALASGLDFRMGVTNVVKPTGAYDPRCIGKFCSVISTNTSHHGGPDRFLLPKEQKIFSACVKNPPCYEGGQEYGLDNASAAVTTHLPRMKNNPYKIRALADLVIIVATDELPNELNNSSLSSFYNKNKLGFFAQAALDKQLKPYLDLFSGLVSPEAAAMFHVIGGMAPSSCMAEVAHGYKDLAYKLGGIHADVCQQNLGDSLQEIIDRVVGRASPVVLDHEPISSSLAVVVDGVLLKRSRTHGFDYRAGNRALALINVKFKKGSQVLAAYKRWRYRAPCF